MQLNRVAELCSYAKGENESGGRLRLALKKGYGSIRFFDAMIWEKTSRQYRAMVIGSKDEETQIETPGFRVKCNPKLLDKAGCDYEDYFDDLMLWAEQQSTQYKYIGIVPLKRDTMKIITREGMQRLVDEVFGEGECKVTFTDMAKEEDEVEPEKTLEELNDANI